MNRNYDIRLNLSPYANYYAPGGNLNFQEVLEEENPDLYAEQLATQKGENKFLSAMNSSGGGGWAAAIEPAATNAANAILDTESSTADRVAGALGIPNLAKIWKADTAKGNANLKLAQQNLDNFNNTYIQDASSSWGGTNAVKLNNQQTIAPISNSNLANLSWKDFRGNMFAKGAAATLQGAAAGSIGGPWGALGGAIVGLAGSLFGGIGAKKRAKAAYADYQAKLGTITSAQNSAYKQAMTNQSLSNMQALTNGNTQQRISDMANIRAYGGNLFDGGGDLTDEQQMVLADIQADPRILFTPKYKQWRDYIRRVSPDYLDRLYASLPYEQQQDIYQNDREAWGALSNKAKGDFGGTQVRKKTDEVSPYVAGALGLVGAMPAMEAVAMFPMLENGLNAYFGYEGAKNLPTAVTDAYDYAKKGDWSRAGLSAGEAVLDGMFIGNGIRGVKNLSELSGLSDKVYNAFPILDPYTTSGATFGYHGTSALDRVLGTIARRNGFTYKPEVPEFHRRLRIDEPTDMRFNEDGDFILSSGRTGSGHDGIVNFATSEPARGHKSHKTLSGIDDYIVNPKALKNQEFISIEPSDTFFETGELAVSPKDITIVSGNTKLLDYAKRKGFNTLSSPRLREYHKKNHAEPTKGKSGGLNITKDGANVSPRDVGDEIQRLTSKRGTPTLEDYRFFENETDLPSGVVPIEEYSSVGQQALYGHSPSLRANLNWNNVAYDPATQVESLYRAAKINSEDAEAAKKYRDYMDNLRRISNNTKAMGGNLYTELSPNLMTLWNNKQQIDQQKALNQQFSLGLGNTAFNKFAGGGPINPPDEFMDRYHPDWGEYTPTYANMTYEEYKQKYGNPNDPDNFDFSPESYNNYHYRLYQPYPNKSTLGNSYLFRPEIEKLNKKYPIENLPVYRDKKGDLYLKRGIKDLYGNNGVYIDGDTQDLTYSRRNKEGDLRVTPHKDEWESGEHSKYRESFEDFKKSSEEQLLNELRRRAYENEFYSNDEVQKYKANNAQKSSSNTNATNKKTTSNTSAKTTSVKKAPSKTTTTKSANSVDTMTFQQMEDYYGQKQSPLLGDQYKNTWANGGQLDEPDVYDGGMLPEIVINSYRSTTPEDAYWRLHKELAARQPGLQDSEDDERAHTYNVLSHQNNPYSWHGLLDNILGWLGYNNTNKDKIYDDKSKFYANGGQMTSADVPNGMQYYANGGTHEENPYGGIQVGTDQQGNPNLVEKGEFRWHDFVFSDRVNVDADLLSSFNLASTTKHQNKKAAKGKLSYADMAKKYAKRNKELENDPISKDSMEAFMQRLANAQEYQKKAEQLEAQKQNELQDYKTALNKQNSNPMYGTMKYNGMGNAATQQGVNAGVDAGIGNPMSNADLSNVNRSGNEMMAAYGGNLFAIGGPDDPNPYEWTLDNLNGRQVLTPWNNNFIGPTLGDNTNLGITPNADNYRWGNVTANTPFYQNENWGLDYKPTYMKVKNPNYNAPAVSTYASVGKNGTIMYDPSGKPFMSYPHTYEGMKSNDYSDTKVIGKTVDNRGFYYPNSSSGSAKTVPVVTQSSTNTASSAINRGTVNSYIPTTQEQIRPIGVPSDNTGVINGTSNISGVSTDIPKKTTTNTNPDAAVPSDPKDVPLYSTAGKYAQFGKGIMPMIWDWANKTNVKYDPNYIDANKLEALAHQGPYLRTADTIGGYRAPDLMDVERLNNSARAEGIAQMQAILDAANGNRGFVGAQSAQNNYNTQMGIGNNYVKTQEVNNANRLQTDQFNHAIDVANQNAINTMRQDNQRAEQAQHQLDLSGTAQAAALRQRENLYADEVNAERMKNRAANQAAYTDNALNFFTTQAMANQELNTRNNDPTNPYWIDKDGRTHYTGDSGLTQAIRDAFGNDEYGRNGTFTGDRLTEWNNLTKKYKAKDLAKHPELWQHLVDKQREANKIDAEKAKQARMEDMNALMGSYQSNLARLEALRDSGAIVSDPSYDLYRGWADEDYSENQGLLRNRNQALDQYITQIGNNYDRYLYEKQLAQNAARALGGYLNPSQSNNNNYYSYTRI